MTVHSLTARPLDVATRTITRPTSATCTFLLFEQFKLDELLGKEPYANWGKDEVVAVLEEAYGWVAEVPRPAQRVRRSTRAASSRTGRSRAPTGFKEAWKALYEAGWRTLAVEEKHGGQAGPFTLAMMVEEFMCGSNTCVQHVPGAHAGRGRGDRRVRHAGAADDATCRTCSTASGRGTMCLTEPHAG